MSKLPTRDEFRAAVFDRSCNDCVVCGARAVDAHHIMERRLFDDGGYYLDNGVALCKICHIDAECTLEDMHPSHLRDWANIQKIILPPHLYPDYEYDKWGNILLPNGTRLRGELFYDESVQKVLKEGGVLDKFLPYVKYPRTYHLPFSPGKTEDDKTLSDCSQFEGREVVATIKMDGENTTGYWDGYVHARSLDSQNHPSRNWVKNYLPGKLCELPKGWRICGENLYAKHSIHYKQLKSYFYLFSIWDDCNNCLSWKDTVEWAQLLDIPTVPCIYWATWDEDRMRTLYKPTYSVLYKEEECEGFVVRPADAFNYSQFRRSVAKYVRAEHVQTNQHWLRTTIVPNELCKNT